jgi:WD40 repeat protein
MLETTLSGQHTRTVTDLAWSPKPPRVLATCSRDKYIHLWDLRASEKPIQSMNSAPCDTMAWNAAGMYLATVHGSEVRVWDSRSEKSAVHTFVLNHSVAAVDWHPSKECEVLTCSEDAVVTVWNVAAAGGQVMSTSSKSPQRRLGYSCKAYRHTCRVRARGVKYSPFGDGAVVLMGTEAQMSSSTSNYNSSSSSSSSSSSCSASSSSSNRNSLQEMASGIQ